MKRILLLCVVAGLLMVGGAPAALAAEDQIFLFEHRAGVGDVAVVVTGGGGEFRDDRVAEGETISTRLRPELYRVEVFDADDPLGEPLGTLTFEQRGNFHVRVWTADDAVTGAFVLNYSYYRHPGEHPGLHIEHPALVQAGRTFVVRGFDFDPNLDVLVTFGEGSDTVTRAVTVDEDGTFHARLRAPGRFVTEPGTSRGYSLVVGSPDGQETYSVSSLTVFRPVPPAAR
jgi:hypothetical protein